MNSHSVVSAYSSESIDAYASTDKKRPRRRSRPARSSKVSDLRHITIIAKGRPK
jgi:hypothetical protein